MEYENERLAHVTLTSSGGEEGSVDGYEVSHTPNLIQFQKFNVEISSNLCWYNGVIADGLWEGQLHHQVPRQVRTYLHSKGLHSSSYLTTYSPQPHNCQGLPLQLHPHVLLAVPPSSLEGSMTLWYMSGQKRHPTNCLLATLYPSYLARALISAQVCSAALIVLPPGVL